MRKKQQKVLKFLVPIVIVAILLVVFWVSYKGETIAGEAVGTGNMMNVYSCTLADNGVNTWRTKTSSRETQLNSCQDSKNTLQYACLGNKLGAMKYTSRVNTCPGEQACAGGRCQCPATKVLCGNACIDTATDENNCGSCGNRCDAGKQCIERNCEVVKKVLFCNVDWFGHEGWDANPIPEERIDDIFSIAQQEVHGYLGTTSVHIDYKIATLPPHLPPLPVGDYYRDSLRYLVERCGGVGKIASYDYLVYVAPGNSRSLFDYDYYAADDQDPFSDDSAYVSLLGYINHNLDDVWGIPLVDRTWEDEAEQLTASFKELLATGH